MTHLPHTPEPTAGGRIASATPAERADRTGIPTPGAITELAGRIADDGLAAHHDEVLKIASIARRTGRCITAAKILADTQGSDTVRLRAFLTIARQWPDIHAAAAHWGDFEASFDALAAQANEHQRLRGEGNLTALWRSRATLDGLRVDAARHRNRLALS